MKKLLFLTLSLITISCSREEIKKQTEITYPVKTAKVSCYDTEVFIETVGHVRSLKNVEIRSRIEGELLQVHFKQGQEVCKGDLLFTIDPRPYEAQLKKSKATLDKTIAELLFSETKMRRYADLVKQEYFSEIDYEQILTDVARLQAMTAENKAQIEEDQINLDYCWIYSPIDGKTGILEIDQGNLVSQDGKTPLITIQQITPIYVEFSIPEKNFPEVQKYRRANTLKVKVSYKDNDEIDFEGQLDLVDNAVNRETGMIKLRGIFANLDKSLWPGQFVRTKLCLYELKNACSVPFEAIVMTQSDPLLFVVNEANRVELRRVKLGQRNGNKIVVLKGVSNNETVVIEGQINLSNGSLVRIQKTETNQNEPI